MRAIALTPEIANMLWDDFRGMMELAAIEHPHESPEDIEHLRTLVRQDKAKLIAIVDGLGKVMAAAVCELVEFRDGRSLHVRYLAGEHMGQWLDELHCKLGEVATGYRCEWISLTGRLGWKRELSKLGYNPIAIQLRARVQVDDDRGSNGLRLRGGKDGM